MRVPSDVSLREWVMQLARDGRLYRFYKTEDWLSLRNAVMEDHHWECERCAELGAWVRDSGPLRRSESRFYARASTVHHEYEVRDHPHMALMRWVDSHEGKVEVLHPLCDLCHNEVHGRLLKGSPTKPPLTEERW